MNEETNPEKGGFSEHNEIGITPSGGLVIGGEEGRKMNRLYQPTGGERKADPSCYANATPHQRQRRRKEKNTCKETIAIGRRGKEGGR